LYIFHFLQPSLNTYCAGFSLFELARGTNVGTHSVSDIHGIGFRLQYGPSCLIKPNLQKESGSKNIFRGPNLNDGNQIQVCLIPPILAQLSDKNACLTFAADPLWDTPTSVVAEITYKPPSLPTSITAPIPKPASEAAYINSLFNLSPTPFDESQPVEVHVVKELSNPHSRAKKQARWQQFQRYKDNLRKDMIASELQNLKGRKIREATAEAMYKWRQAIEDEKKRKQKARWMTKERVKKMERNRKLKQKKTRRQSERLRDLVLADAPNQVVPRQGKAASRAVA